MDVRRSGVVWWIFLSEGMFLFVMNWGLEGVHKISFFLWVGGRLCRM